MLEHDWTSQTTAMTLSSKENSLMPIGTPANAGAPSVAQQSGLVVDLGETRRDGSGPEPDRFAVYRLKPELVGSTLRSEFYFASFTMR